MRLVHEKCGSLEQGAKENQMIVVRITNGLGNQMYQYALLLSLKKIYKDIDIKIDTNHYERVKSHTGYSLDKVFGIKECVASEEECRKVYSGCRYYKGFGREGLSFQPLRMLYRRVYSKIGNLVSSGNESHMIHDYKFNIFNPEVFNLDPKRDWYLSGYWQNLQYFDWNKEEGKKVFDFSLDLDERKKELVAEMLSCNSVSVHVRRGDYAVMRVLIAMMIVVPFCVLVNDFIAIWVGAEYILPASVVMLLVMDLYIHFVHSVNVDFINAAGLFREDRDNEIIAAVLNITLSILGAKTIGLAGVLLGTVVSQMWFWFGRSYVVFKLCLQADKEDYLKYWLKNIVDGIALTASIVFCAYLNSRLPIANGYLKFVCSGILCEAVSVILFGVFHFRDPEVRKMLKYLVNHIRKR